MYSTTRTSVKDKLDCLGSDEPFTLLSSESSICDDRARITEFRRNETALVRRPLEIGSTRSAQREMQKRERSRLVRATACFENNRLFEG